MLLPCIIRCLLVDCSTVEENNNNNNNRTVNMTPYIHVRRRKSMKAILSLFFFFLLSFCLYAREHHCFGVQHSTSKKPLRG